VVNLHHDYCLLYTTGIKAIMKIDWITERNGSEIIIFKELPDQAPDKHVLWQQIINWWRDAQTLYFLHGYDSYGIFCAVSAVHRGCRR
jgi:hypothetical protein